MDQTISPLTERERAWMLAQRENAVSFVEAFSPQDAGKPPSLGALDRAFAAWISSVHASDTNMVNEIINYVGVSFGSFLVDELGFEWVIATDKHGSDLAVYALPGTGDVLVYPANFVAKRWERRETNFLETCYEKIAKQLQQIRESRSRK